MQIMKSKFYLYNISSFTLLYIEVCLTIQVLERIQIIRFLVIDLSSHMDSNMDSDMDSNIRQRQKIQEQKVVDHLCKGLGDYDYEYQSTHTELGFVLTGFFLATIWSFDMK